MKLLNALVLLCVATPTFAKTSISSQVQSLLQRQEKLEQEVDSLKQTIAQMNEDSNEGKYIEVDGTWEESRNRFVNFFVDLGLDENNISFRSQMGYNESNNRNIAISMANNTIACVSEFIKNHGREAFVFSAVYTKENIEGGSSQIDYGLIDKEGKWTSRLSPDYSNVGGFSLTIEEDEPNATLCYNQLVEMKQRIEAIKKRSNIL